MKTQAEAELQAALGIKSAADDQMEGKKIPVSLGMGTTGGGFAIEKGDSVDIYLPNEDYVDGYEVYETAGKHPSSEDNDAELARLFELTTGRPAKQNIMQGADDVNEGGYIITWDTGDVSLWRTLSTTDGTYEEGGVWWDDMEDDLREDGHPGWAASSMSQ